MRAAAPLVFLLAIGCMRPDLRFASPDHAHIARVENHWSIDPPKQSLWLDDTKIADLAEDMDWCHQVVWSPKSVTAGFLVQDAKLITVDVATKQIVSTRWLADRGEMVCNLQITDDGQLAYSTKTPAR
jgi:hypothetical protein